MNAITELAPSVGTSRACRALAIPRGSFYRQKASITGDPPAKDRRRPARCLTDQERQQVLDELHSDRFVDKAPAEVYSALLDEGIYLCSIRSMYRILSDAEEVRERRNQVRHPNYKKPELLATRPNEVWSWDITKLLGPAKWQYFYLYVILDIFSRYVVGWMVATRESADLARRLIRETVEKQDVLEDQLIIHSDRGPSMKSHGVAQLLASLGITKSHSRPHVSNDNPFSESQFKTLKYRPDFPSRFGCPEDAHSFCRAFFKWYNDDHYHWGIGLLTPESVHYGNANEILAKRQTVLNVAYARHPERFVNKAPSPPKQPMAVWINPPPVETQTCSGPVAAKTELEISPLTSAETLTRPWIPEDIQPSLNSQAQEKRLPEIVDLGKPEAPHLETLARPRPGYPLADQPTVDARVPAELASVSPGNAKPIEPIQIQQSPLDARAMPQKIPGVWGLAPKEPERTRPAEEALH